MVDKLEEGKTYKCIDLEGYYSESVLNVDCWKELSDGNSYKIEEVTTTGEGMIKGNIVIDCDEFQYFELVEEGILWDGKEPLEVGMTVGWMGRSGEFEVVFIQTNSDMKTFTVLKDCAGNIHLSYINLLTSLLPAPREEFAAKMVGYAKKWNRCQDSSEEELLVFAGMCYDKLKGAGNA